MRISLALTVLLALLGCPVSSLAQAQTAVTPPGPNIALNKPYTLDPLPNYGDCSLDPQRKLLTDGEYTKGYFWVQKTTVGWVHKRPVAITIDLGQVQPIAGLSYNTAAGSADVAWPSNILIMVSDDGKLWNVLGDLVKLSNQQGAPPAKPYRIHRFATGSLQARGRYVALVVDCVPYMVVDEIEVYGGRAEWLSLPVPGKQVNQTPLEYRRASQMLFSVKSRLQTDLEEIGQNMQSARLGGADQAGLLARAAALQAEITALDTPPPLTTTILPLSELHERVYALQAPVLRARGFPALTVWENYRYDMLQPLQTPARPPTAPLVLTTSMMRHERRAEVLNLTNATDQPLRATVQVTGLAPGLNLVTPREVLFTDTLALTPIAAAILPPQVGAGRLRLTIPAGMTRQVWLDLNSRDLPAGSYRAVLKIAAGREAGETNVPLTVRVTGAVMPDEFDLAIGGWDETNNKGGYEVTAENMKPLINNLREHGVNMPWSNPQVMPTPGAYDAAGNMTTPPDFTSWDEWVERWRGARCWGLFPNVRNSFAGEPMGTPRFNKMVGAWATAWVQHAAAQGIKPQQIMLLLVDEPRSDEHDQIIIAWAKALKAAQPGLVIWNDPLHVEPEKAAPEFYEFSDVLCPNAPRFLNFSKPYRDFYVAQQQAGRELWFYSCSGPAKLLDPISYFRGQFWLNLKYGGKGSLYWAFGDEAGDSWNAYRQSRNQYSPLFLSRTDATDAKHMEAIREGAQDYQLFQMLAARVAQLEGRGVSSRLLVEAKKLLVTGPEQVVALMGGEKMKWTEPKNRPLVDQLRLQALELLEKLSQL